MSFMESMLTELSGLSPDSGMVSALTGTLATYNPTANNTIIGVMRSSTFAIGASLLTLFMLLELIVMINRSGGESHGLSGTKLPANILIRFAVFAVLFTQIPVILQGIESVAVDVSANIVSAASFDTNVGISSGDISTIAEAIDDLSFFDKAFTYVVVLLYWLFSKLIMGIIQITAVFRLFELWILLLLSPIPLATLASSEFKQTAINFLKYFTSVGLRSAGIICCFVIYNALIGSLIKGYDPSVDVSQYIHGILLDNIIYLFALAVSVFCSGKIVNKIMGVI